MLSRKLCMGSLVVFAACAGSSTGNPVAESPSIDRLDEDTFRVIDAKAGGCSDERASDPEKLHPERATLEEELGDESAEFVVMMEREVSLTAFPLPGQREDISEDEPVFVARAQEIAQTQACALGVVAELGGTYVHSFLLINAFVAELTVAQAVALSELHDVRLVEASESSEPPPSL